MSQANKLSFLRLSPKAQHERMQREFALLQRQEDHKKINFSTSLKNRHKNRYLDILANEESIYPMDVVKDSKAHPHYINGNLIDLGLSHTFVACQAPVLHGIPDFLATLYDKQISLVVMLTNLRESGIVKADRYWPEGGNSPMKVPGADGLTIAVDPENPLEIDAELHITRRSLILQRPNEEKHKLLHVQYTGWPDHGVPQSFESLDALVSIIRDWPTNSPVFTHCSAGIGRTGTLIAAYAVLAHLERGSLCDRTVYEVVSAMRAKRFGMVQRVEQYFVIYLYLMSHLGVDVKPLEKLLCEKATTGPSGR